MKEISLILSTLAVAIITLILPGCSHQQWDEYPPMMLEEGTDYSAVIKTNYGDISIDLFEDEAPLAVNNFVFLSKEGFYDGVKFHRILRGFVMQTGDPTGTGSGGPGYTFPDEPVTRDYEAGTVAMANSGSDTNGSQFFITLSDLSSRLPSNYTIFGVVTGGVEVCKEIAAVDVKDNGYGEVSKPTEKVYMETVSIIEN